jgi:hypothetical protein
MTGDVVLSQLASAGRARLAGPVARTDQRPAG